MKCLFPILFLFSSSAFAQVATDSVYPVFRSLSVTIPKKTTAPDLNFRICAAGNCESGEGVLLQSQMLAGANAWDHPVRLTLLKGSFSDAGKAFTGLVYQAEVQLDWKSSGKQNLFQARPSLDFNNNRTLDSLFIGKGEAKIGPLPNSSNQHIQWHGNVRLRHFEKTFPEVKTFTTVFENGKMYWADLEYKEGSHFRRFTGRVFESGFPFSGKAVLPDSSTSEGFFLGYSLVGPGIRTSRLGKRTEGFFGMDSLWMETPIVLPEVLSARIRPASVRNFYGKMKNDRYDGWGLIESGRRFMLFPYKDGQIVGAGMIMDAPLVNNDGWNEESFSYKAGFFEGEQLTKGMHLTGENIKKLNAKVFPMDLPRMLFAKAKMFIGDFNKAGRLEGCGIETFLGMLNYNYSSHKFKPGAAILARYSNGYFSGWSVDLLKLQNTAADSAAVGHYGASAYELDLETLKKWEMDTVYCHPAIPLYKAGYLHRYRAIALQRMASRGAEQKQNDSLRRVFNFMPVKERCAYYTARQKYKVGSLLKTKGYGSFGSDAFILSFDCNTGTYTVMTRTYNAGRKTFFKTDDEVAYYALSKLTLTESYIDGTYQVLGTEAEICSVCGGHGANYRNVIHTAGGTWETTYNPHVRVYTPERVIASWKERVPCTFCKGDGWRKKP